jgi:hypothetical protein
LPLFSIGESGEKLPGPTKQDSTFELLSRTWDDFWLPRQLLVHPKWGEKAIASQMKARFGTKGKPPSFDDITYLWGIDVSTLDLDAPEEPKPETTETKSTVETPAPKVEIGLQVQMTSDLAQHEKACKNAGLSWPDRANGKPRKTQLGLSGRIEEVNISQGTLHLPPEEGWVPICSLVGYENWKAPDDVAEIEDDVPPLPTKSIMKSTRRVGLPPMGAPPSTAGRRVGLPPLPTPTDSALDDDFEGEGSPVAPLPSDLARQGDADDPGMALPFKSTRRAVGLPPMGKGSMRAPPMGSKLQSTLSTPAARKGLPAYKGKGR